METKAKLQATAARCEKEAARLHEQRETLRAELEQVNARRPELLKRLANGKDVSGELLKLNLKTDELTARAEGIELLQTEIANEYGAATAALSEIATEEARLERERYGAELTEKARATLQRRREAYRTLAEVSGEFAVEIAELVGYDRGAAHAIDHEWVGDDELTRAKRGGARETYLPGFEGCGPCACPALVWPDAGRPFQTPENRSLDAESVRQYRAAKTAA
jgi:hypothetical protein